MSVASYVLRSDTRVFERDGMTNYSQGHYAEKIAAEYIRHKKYELIDTNWRTRYCEIDLIARRGKVMHFIEVKYRANVAQGSGLEYITTKKLQQMQFAAELWVSEHGWRGPFQLSALEVSGDRFEVTAFIETIEL